MAKITPEAFDVLSRIKRYGLDTWLPGRLVISRLEDTTFTRANAAIIADLITNGYLTQGDAGLVAPALAGDDMIRRRPTAISETRRTIAGRRFQVLTDDWAVEADARRLRGLILSGLASIAETAPDQFERIYSSTRDDDEDDALRVIVVSALSIVTAQYSDAFSSYAHRVGIRIWGTEGSENEEVAESSMS